MQLACWLIASVVVAGCAVEPSILDEPSILGESCVLDDSEGTWQLSPTGQAVALVDPVAYGRLLGHLQIARARTDCIAKEFLGRMESDAEAIVLIHDVEGWLYSLNRLLIERGLDPIRSDDLSNLPCVPPFCPWGLNPIGPDTSFSTLPAGIASEVFATLDTLPQPTRGAFAQGFRFLESGLGRVPEGGFIWVPTDLRGYLFLPERQELVEGKFLHELAHFWAAHLTGPPVLAQEIERTAASHWSYTSVGGVLGGWLPDTLESLGDNLYRARIALGGWAQNAHFYAPLELYLMGLAEAEEVPPIEIAIDAEMVENISAGLQTFTVSSFETVTIEDIIEANGPRMPSFDESEKHFRLALIILTDHELSDAEWGFYSRSIDFASAAQSRDVLDFFPEETYPEYYHTLSIKQERLLDDLVLLNFYMATGGRGTIEFVPIAAK